jgi:hypothetical protein
LTPKETTAEAEAAAERADNEVNDVDDDADEGDDDDSGSPCGCSSNALNCSDFGSQTAAQACFDHCVSVTGRDIHRLDDDNDGAACEDLP